MVPENAVQWTSDLERFEVVSGGPGEVGAKAHLHYVQNGRPYVMEDVLEEVTPGQYYRSQVSGGGMMARVETWLRPAEGGTDLTIRWAGSGRTLVTRLLLPLLRGTIARRTRTDLESFKTLVETHGARFPS